MTQLLEAVEQIARSFEIVSDTRFRLLGRAYSPEDAQPSSGHGALTAPTAELLSDQLYQILHCRNAETLTNTILPRYGRSNERDFVALLARANRGTGAWEDGWSVQRIDEGGLVHVAAHGVELCAAADEFRGSSGDVVVGASGRVRFPHELRGMSVGYYVALGNLHSDDEPDLIRVYWNVRVHGAEGLLGSITEALNAAGVSFKFKTLRNPESYHRTDAAVLYVPRFDWDRTLPLVAVVYAKVRPWLRTTVSNYVFQLAPGLGLAEDPPGRMSFGEHRSAVIAEAFVAGHADREPMRAVQAAIEKSGLDLARFHANPGSPHRYASL